ncbi:hypothetical protein PspLS_08202 [Pyricularia sp. CBS 133598]|nr:hypothetical protein PspLS_08202 [Pyricularia sp. CBS 133598]
MSSLQISKRPRVCRYATPGSSQLALSAESDRVWVVVTAEGFVHCVGDHDNSVHGACVLGQGTKLNRARGQGGLMKFYRWPMQY